MTSIQHIADETEHKMRLDHFITAHMDDLSRSFIKRLIDDKHIVVNGEKASKTSYKVQQGDVIDVTIPELEETHIVAQEIPLDIIYEDDDLLVINKQAGLTVHPGAGQKDGTLVNALLFHCKDSLSGIGGVERPGIVHRLDKETSGLMVVAKHDIAHRNLSEQLKERDLKRHYQALVWGIPSPPSGVIDAKLGRHVKERTKRMVSNRSDSRDACTHYKVVESYAKTASLVECTLDTGRTHQIRVHMKHIGHALIGDRVYDRKRNLSPYVTGEAGQKEFVENFNRQALHAYKLAFRHPISGDILQFECNLLEHAPEDMIELHKSLKGLQILDK